MKQLLLFGGDATFAEGHRYFVAQCRSTKLVLLMIHSAKWRTYAERYTREWPVGYEVIVPAPDGSLTVQQLETIATADGIFIAGGHTPTYISTYVHGAVADILRTAYERGVVIAGSSAGALISLQTSFLSPDESPTGEVTLFNGLGLLRDVLIAVHYSEWNEEPHLRKALQLSGITRGYGIDERMTLVFADGTLVEVIGHMAHEIHNEAHRS